jgi:hypothetical protein
VHRTFWLQKNLPARIREANFISEIINYIKVEYYALEIKGALKSTITLSAEEDDGNYIKYLFVDKQK